jgi:hypothetical protein
MNINDEVYVIQVYEVVDERYEVRKFAELYKMTGCILEIGSQEHGEIIYLFGSARHGGQIGYDCFLTQQEAENRVNGLNDYFYRNDYLA